MKIIVAVISTVLFIGFCPAYAQEVELIDPDDIREKFETSLTVIKEHLETIDPPRYFMHKAEISFAVTTGMDGNIEGKIPVAVGSVSFDGNYGEVRTKRETYTYSPRTSIPVNFEDLGVVAFLTGLQEDVGGRLQDTEFLVTGAEHEEEFVIVLSGEGKLNFLSVLSFGVGVEVQNSHKMTFHFCLLGNDGQCEQ